MPQQAAEKKKWYRGKPVLSAAVLFLIVAGCLCCELIMTKDPLYLDLQNCQVPPNREFLFGTDTLGRDIFSMIWYGGRISLQIGVGAACIASGIAIVFGAVNGCAPAWADVLLVRFTEILLSVPGLLLVILLQAVLGKANGYTMSFVIGITSWMSMAKMIRTEVRQIRNSAYVQASVCMGGSFWHILRKHLAPNFIPSMMFMAVMNIRSAIASEAALSFMGLGLPVEVVSWGSMLSLSQKALFGGAWWMILIPGAFLITTLVCITNLCTDKQWKI
ncbi:MAG: ABC transporter permease [Eubacterium sp.]|nr:ABC transporter permease [Eubacterium sp.]